MGNKKTALFIDGGFGASKWKAVLADEVRQGKFMTAFRQDNGFGAILCEDGKRYLIGDEAYGKADPKILVTVEELEKWYPRIVSKSIDEAKIPEFVDDLVIGFPLESWIQERAKNTIDNALVRLRQALMTVKVNNKEYRFGKVTVYPQGVGGVEEILVGDASLAGNILGIDIGNNTVIALVYNRETRKVLYSKTLFKHGVQKLALEYLKPKLIEGGVVPPDRSFSSGEISFLLEKGEVQKSWDEYVDIRAEIKVASADYARDLIAQIKQDLQINAGVAGFKTVGFFGGGARHFPQIKGNGIVFKYLENPEYGNVKGFQIMHNLGFED